MDVFSDIRAKKSDIINAGCELFKTIFHGKPSEDLEDLRFDIFSQQAAAGSIKPEKLPPTTGAAAQHSLWAYIQTRDWLLLQSPSLDVLDFKCLTPQRIITMSWMYIFLPITWGAVVSSYTVELYTVDSAGCCWCARPLLSSLWSSTSSAVTWFVPENTLASLRKTDLYYRNMRLWKVLVLVILCPSSALLSPSSHPWSSTSAAEGQMKTSMLSGNTQQ
ncbi:unnamed protein product [Arctogadus glacialis]